MAEKDLQKKMYDYFSEWFYVQMEVRSDPDSHGKRDSRIDLTLQHKQYPGEDFLIGIEVKQDEIKSGAELAEWLHQAHRYAHRTFGYRQFHVCVYPHVSVRYLREGTEMHQHDAARYSQYSTVHHDFFHEHYNTSSFLYGAFKIGEIQKVPCRGKLIIRIVINCKIIWESTYPYRLRTNNFPKLPDIL